MIRFFLFVFIIIIIIKFISKNKLHYYFNYKLIDTKYNLCELNYIYYDNNNIIRKDKMIVIKSDCENIIEVLEDCYLNNIKIKG